MSKVDRWAVAAILTIISIFVYQRASADSLQILNPANGHKYQRFDSPTTWYNSETYCESLGGHLATSTSQAENDFLSNNFFGSGIDCWIGGTDEAVEGTWKWVNGETWSYENWYPGEPNNSQGIEDCNALYFSKSPSGQWNDGSCLSQVPFVCEWECPDSDGDGFYSEPGCGTEVDCDDNDPKSFPGFYYRDADGDGFGDPNNSIFSCPAPEGCYVSNDTDCDDTDPNINPSKNENGRHECKDGLDNDCDGFIDCDDSVCAGKRWCN